MPFDKPTDDNKTFCMLPWIHAYVEPSGNVLPCCTTDGKLPFGSVKNESLKNIVMYSDHFKQMRLNMLAGKTNPSCTFCYKTEKTQPWSFRTYANESFNHHIDDVIAKTNDDGSLQDFKMYYYDIRFSNICNFKCRTCGSAFSSSWASENRVYDKTSPIIIHADDNKGALLSEVLNEHIDNIELAYFAGGEPLITEEHYLVLEELIKRNKTNITLRYNTNLSNFKFKDYDVISMWKKFKKIELSASIDHYGERAEYIRSGTDWGVMETNLKQVTNYDFIDYQFNTVLSIFNYYTLADFYSYMKDKGFYRRTDRISLFPCMDPPYFSSQVLPKGLKGMAEAKLKTLYHRLKAEQYFSIQTIKNGIAFASADDLWDQEKNNFRDQIKIRDDLREEDFVKTFPELKNLMS